MTGSKRILVIESDRPSAEETCQLLTDEGFEVATAHRGDEGIDRLRAESFDLVITDLVSPDVDGLAVLRHLHDRSPQTLAIVATDASVETKAILDAMHHAAFDCLPQPCEPSELLATVRRAFQRIEREQLQSDMISMISHDIKVPLTSIIGYTSLLRDRRRGDWHPRAEDFLSIITTNANRILALLDNYMTTCKIDAGQLSLHLTEASMSEMLADVQSALGLEAEKRNICLSVHCPPDLPPLRADENLLFRAICNLVNNALKYSPTGCTVQIRAWYQAADNSALGSDSLNLAVENPGEGIPQEEIPHIFRRYRRSQSSRGIDGIGIGLFVVRTVIEAHGGKVSVESRPSESTCFTLHLPLSPREDGG